MLKFLINEDFLQWRVILVLALKTIQLYLILKDHLHQSIPWAPED